LKYLLGKQATKLVIDKTGASELEIQARFKKYLAHIKSYQKKTTKTPSYQAALSADAHPIAIGEKRPLPGGSEPPTKKTELVPTISMVPPQLDDVLTKNSLSDSVRIIYFQIVSSQTPLIF
jgi:hypothetical protein